MKLPLFLLFLLAYSLCAQSPHPVPQLKDLYKPWVFARASEASTLFIEPHYKGVEPFGQVIELSDQRYWHEFDGTSSVLWKIDRYEEEKEQLTLFFEDGGRLLVVPYWDIDHCLLIIRFTTGTAENPTRFSVPYSFLPEIPYLDGED